MSSEAQVAFVREALRDALNISSADLHPGAPIVITESVLDHLARVGTSSTLTWMISAAQNGDIPGAVVEVNADDAMRGGSDR